MLVNSNTSPENQNTTLPQPGDYTINIQATDDWVVMGKYHDHVLQAITLNKLTHKKGGK